MIAASFVDKCQLKVKVSLIFVHVYFIFNKIEKVPCKSKKFSELFAKIIAEDEKPLDVHKTFLWFFFSPGKLIISQQ